MKYDDGEGTGKTALARTRGQAPNSPPSFGEGSSTSRTIDENLPGNSPVGDPVTAADPDHDTGDQREYTLDGTGQGAFTVDSATGQVSTRNELDHEDEDSYTITITATDRNTETDTIDVNISVNDLNEAPEFSTENVSFSIQEDAPAEHEVGTVTATDVDHGQTIGYAINGTSSEFSINPGTGAITLRQTGLLDYDQGRRSYTLSVTATDNGTPVMNDKITVNIAVTDVDEIPTLTGSTTASYPENSTDTVSTYEATDPEGAEITWSLSGDDAGLFEINDGTLTFGDPPDFEQPGDDGDNNAYEVTIEASDDTTATRKISLTVTVTVTDENEAPHFPKEQYTLNIPENTVGVSSVGTPVTAEDPDHGDTLSYGMDETGTPFTLGETTGQIELNSGQTLDHETNPLYDLTIKVQDTAGLTARTRVRILVDDLNELPAFDTDTTRRRVDEATDGATAGNAVTAVDPNQDRLTYGTATPDTPFIVNTLTGVISVPGGTTLDYETTRSHNLTVTVTDNLDDEGNQDSATDDSINVTITVNNVEEAGTVTLSNLDPGIGDTITAELTDPDAPTGDFALNISSQSWTWRRAASPMEPDWAEIPGSSSTGSDTARYTATTADNNRYIQAMVEYTDPEGAGKTAARNTTGGILNRAPRFDAGAIELHIAENSPAGSPVGTPVTATDPDVTEENNSDQLTYSLAAGDPSFFDTDDTGQIRTNNLTVLDHEVQENNRYELTLRATDSLGSTADIAITVIVDNVNESPELTGPVYLTHPENLSGKIQEYTATDPDAGTAFEWSLSGPDADLFSAADGELALRAPRDYETPGDRNADNDHLITIVVSDGDLTDTLEVTIRISNEVESMNTEEGTEPECDNQVKVNKIILLDENGEISQEGETHFWTVKVDPFKSYLIEMLGADSGNDVLGDDTYMGDLTLEDPQLIAVSDADTDKSAGVFTNSLNERTRNHIALFARTAPGRYKFKVGSGDEVEPGDNKTGSYQIKVRVNNICGIRDGKLFYPWFGGPDGYMVGLDIPGDNSTDQRLPIVTEGYYRYSSHFLGDNRNLKSEPDEDWWNAAEGYENKEGFRPEDEEGFEYELFEYEEGFEYTVNLWTPTSLPEEHQATQLKILGIYDSDGMMVEGTASSDNGKSVSTVFRPTITGEYFIAVGSEGTDRKGVYMISGTKKEIPESEEATQNTPATGQPTISGTARVGETLAVETSGIEDQDALSNADFAYQWIRNDWTIDTDIAGATSPSYTLVSGDEDKAIKVRVTFTDDAGNQESLTSAAVASVSRSNALPAPPGSPTVSPKDTGALEVSWKEAPDDGRPPITGYLVQWKEATANWETEADVLEATVTGTTHTIAGLTDGVEYAIRVIATSEAGDSPASDEAFGTPRETTPPELSTTTVDGTTLTLTYDEGMDEDSVPGADAFAVMTDSDEQGVDQVSVVGRTVTLTLDPGVMAEDAVTVSYTAPTDETAPRIRDEAGNHGAPFSNQAAANNTSREEPPQRPKNLIGIANEDGSVTLTWDDPGDETITGYQILRRLPTEGEPTLLVYVDDTGSVATTYTDANVSAGIEHVYRVKAINAGGLSEWSDFVNVTPLESREAPQNTPATGKPTITGTAQVGKTLTADTSGIEDGDGLDNATFSYQWLGDDSEIQGATLSTYILADSDEGKTVRVQVSFTDDAGNGETLTSVATAPVKPEEIEATQEPPAQPTGLHRNRGP